MAYNYKDILLQPRFSELGSRSEADPSCWLGNKVFRLPVVPANMKTIIDEDLAIWFAENDYFYVMHRFGIDSINFIKNMNNRGLFTSISIGVNQDSYEVVSELNRLGLDPDYVTIDIAHGHCQKMRNMLQYVKQNLKSFVIAGNVCTKEGVRFLQDLGADAIKVGIGPGHSCTTKLKTGFSHPQFSAVLSCAEEAKVPVIADGGIEHPGDIAKALVAGATMAMAGFMFAGFEESPGEKKIFPDGRIVKEYFGSASEHNKGEKKHVEGRKIEIPYKGSIVDLMSDLDQSIRSSISYAGGKDLSAFIHVPWITVH